MPERVTPAPDRIECNEERGCVRCHCEGEVCDIFERLTWYIENPDDWRELLPVVFVN